MDQEDQSMIKPPADSDDRRNSLEPRSSSSSSSWMNCAGLTMLVLSLVLSVAALWIPWQRFGELEGDIRQMEARYEEMMKMINRTREEDITFQQSLINSPELLKSLDSASRESDELLKAILKKISKNEKTLETFSTSYRELEEKLQKQIQELHKQKEIRNNDRVETRKILDDIKDLMLKANLLEQAVERSQADLQEVKAVQKENANNITRLEEKIEHFTIDTNRVEGRINDTITKHQVALLSSEQKWNSDYKRDLQTEIEKKVQALRETVSKVSGHIDNQVETWSEKVEQKIQSVADDNSKWQRDMEELDEKLTALDERISLLSGRQEVSATVEDLESRVKSLNIKLNMFVQNVVAVKTLPQIVENLKKRLKSVENSL